MVKNENRNFSYMTRRIGGTTYKVKVVFSDTEHETMEDKILRMPKPHCTNSAISSMARWDSLPRPGAFTQMRPRLLPYSCGTTP